MLQIERYSKYFSKLFLCNKFMSFVNKVKPLTLHTKKLIPRLIKPWTMI